MSRYQNLILCGSLAFAATVQAQTENTDTVKSKELDEVVVQAQNQRTGTSGTVYIPSGRQKNAAQNAMDLLRVMAIPQLQVNPASNSVTDNVGQDVDIYINYLPASREEMQGLRIKDVKKVEYLEYPTDPRFHGAPKVINIIVQQYAYGGYTKLSASESVLTGLNSNASVYSKFSYRRMTYDLYAGASNSDIRHGGSSTFATYSLLDKAGQSYTLQRDETMESYKEKTGRYPVTLRATYNSDKVQIRNTVGFTHQSTPEGLQEGRLSYLPGNGKDYDSERSSTSHSNSLSYSGSCFLSLPRSLSLDISPLFQYSHTNDAMTYNTTATEPIVRNARENSYYLRGDVNLTRKFGEKHSLLAGVSGSEWRNRLHYTGTDVYNDRFHHSFAAVTLGYNYSSQRLALNLDGGVSWEKNKINDVSRDDAYPFIHLNVRYSPNNRNMLSAFFQVASYTPDISQKASDILKSNELLYITGNPRLKNSRVTNLNLSYSCIPSNALSVQAFAQGQLLFKKYMQYYSPHEGGVALLRGWTNSGNFFSGVVGAAFNLKLLQGNLQIYASPNVYLYDATGLYGTSCYPFMLRAQATYYLGDFYFMGYYQTRQKYLMWQTTVKVTNRNYHFLSLGWGHGPWNLSVTATNFLNKGWKTSDMEFVSDLYTDHTVAYGTTYHPRLELSATYTFGYGKKVQRGNEVGEQGGAESAIMK